MVFYCKTILLSLYTRKVYILQYAFEFEYKINIYYFDMLINFIYCLVQLGLSSTRACSLQSCCVSIQPDAIIIFFCMSICPQIFLLIPSQLDTFRWNLSCMICIECASFFHILETCRLMFKDLFQIFSRIMIMCIVFELDVRLCIVLLYY